MENIFFDFEYDDTCAIYDREASFATPGRKEDICVLHGKTLETYETIMEFLRTLVIKKEKLMSYHGLGRK